MEDNEIIIDLNDNSNDITIEQNPAAGTATSNYNDLNNKPKINNVELAGNKTAAQLGFATVATTGSYDDLDDKPTIPDVQVATATTTGDNKVYCVNYINTMIGDVEAVLTTLTTGGGVS